MSDYEVAPGVDMPKRDVGRAGFARGRTKYPWEKMAVGDSFSAPAAERRNLATAAYWNTRTSSHRYALRSMIEDGVERVRCWRIS